MSQVVKLRWWLLNELTIHGTDLASFPPAPVIFQQAEAEMLPAGASVEKETSRASTPLHELLKHTVKRCNKNLLKSTKISQIP